MYCKLGPRKPDPNCSRISIRAQVHIVVFSFHASGETNVEREL